MPASRHCACGHRWEEGPGPTDAPQRCPACGAAAPAIPETVLSATSGTQFPVPPVVAHDLASPGRTTTVDRRADWPAVPGYEVLDELGRGGMGVVFKARQVGLNRLVALKVIRAAGDDQEERERFHREAEALAALQHPNVVQIYEVGEHQGRPFFALEFMAGGSLAERLRRQPLSFQQAASLVETLARAMHQAHAQGLVHRDLKPANVLLTSHDGNGLGTPKITDFGLVKRLDSQIVQTRTGAVMGTPAYMAPEQARGSKEVGPAVDVWALGVLLYECLTGRLPFRGDDPFEVLGRVLAEEPLPPSRHNARVPRDLETICLKCLEKDPKRRYASAQALADDLRRFSNDEPIQARRTSMGQRVVKWARRRPARAAILGLAVVVLLAGAGLGLWFWDSYHRVKVEYYAHWVYRFGEPQGVGRLAEEQVRRRQWSLKFFRQAGRVLALEVVDSRGRPTSRHGATTFLGSLGPDGSKQPVCRYEFQRNDQGRLTAQVARDRAGQVVWAFHYDTPETGHYSDSNGYIRTASGSGAAYVQFTLSPEGFIQAIRYCDLHRRPQTGHGGLFGYRSDNDDRGLERHRTILGPDGRPALCPDGYAACTMARDDMGNVTELTFLDAAGRPTPGRDGYARKRWKYDEHGNQTEEAYFDVEDRPALDRSGIARWVAAYDEHGNMTHLRYFGTDDRPILHVDGNAGWTAQYDEDGNTVELTYLDTAGRPTPTKYGIATIRRQFDADGNPTEQAYFGPDGQPALHRDGNARVTASYDAAGRVLHQAFFGLDGKPTWLRDGYARIDRRYGPAGHLVDVFYSGVDGKPALGKNGYARARREHDERGNITLVTYHGVDGRPIVSTQGFAQLRRRYDTHGQLIEESYFDTQGRPTLSRSGYARVTFTRDEQGNTTEQRFFDPEGKPCRDRDGFARITARYNARGQATEVAYFGPDGKPALHASGNARFTAKYDDRGNRIEEAYRDAGGKLVMVAGGYAVMLARFNNQGHQIEHSYLDANRKLVKTKQYGYARMVVIRDAHGNAVKTTFFDTRGNPTMNNEGFATAVNTFDARGNRIERAYFDQHGKPTAGWHRESYRYDNWGRVVERTFRDGAGRLAGDNLGRARTTFMYDLRGNCIERAYFDRNNRPGPEHARERLKYDHHGNVVEIVFLDAQDRLVMTSGGWARWTARYDERGNQIERAFFDQAGRLRSGWARERTRYDNRNNPVEISYWSADGKPALFKDGYARGLAVYNDHNKQTDAVYFDLENRPVQTRVVVTLVRVGWQGQALKVGDVLESYDGKPIVNWSRFIRLRETERAGDPPRQLVVLRRGKRLTFTVRPGLLGITMADRVIALPGKP